MAANVQAILEAVIDARKSKKGAAEHNKATDSMVKANKRLNTSAKDTTGGLRAMAGSVRTLAKGAGVAALALGFKKLGGSAIGFERAEVALKGLSKRVGQSSDAIVEAMKRGSDGMITSTDAMQQASKGLLLQVAKTPAEFERLTNVATKLGAAMGQTASKSMDDLITALGRVSPLILDNLGITVSIEKANIKYAASLGKTAAALTDTEKKQAFFNEALRKGEDAIKTLGAVTETTSSKWQKLWAKLVEFTRPVGAAIKGLIDIFLDLGLALSGDADAGGRLWLRMELFLEAATLGVKALGETIKSVLKWAINNAFDFFLERAADAATQFAKLPGFGWTSGSAAALRGQMSSEKWQDIKVPSWSPFKERVSRLFVNPTGAAGGGGGELSSDASKWEGARAPEFGETTSPTQPGLFKTMARNITMARNEVDQLWQGIVWGTVGAANAFSDMTQGMGEDVRKVRIEFTQMEIAILRSRDTFSSFLTDAVFEVDNLRDAIVGLGKTISKIFFEEIVAKRAANALAHFATNILPTGRVLPNPVSEASSFSNAFLGGGSPASVNVSQIIINKPIDAAGMQKSARQIGSAVNRSIGQ